MAYEVGDDGTLDNGRVASLATKSHEHNCRVTNSLEARLYAKTETEAAGERETYVEEQSILDDFCYTGVAGSPVLVVNLDALRS